MTHISAQRSDSDWPQNLKWEGPENFENRARNGQETLRSVLDNLANLNDVNLKVCLQKGLIQIAFEILSGKDANSLKIRPEMAEKLQGQSSSPWVG